MIVSFISNGVNKYISKLRVNYKGKKELSTDYEINYIDKAEIVLTPLSNEVINVAQVEGKLIVTITKE